MISQLFLQGEIQIGKSHLIHSKLNLKTEMLGGFFVTRYLENGQCKGFFLNNIRWRDDSDCRAKNKYLFLEKVGDKFVANNIVLERFVKENILCQLDDKKISLMVLDEIGGVELECSLFKETLYKILGSNIPCIGTIKSFSNSKLVASATSDNKIITANKELFAYLENRQATIITLTDTNKNYTSSLIDSFFANFNLCCG